MEYKDIFGTFWGDLKRKLFNREKPEPVKNVAGSSSRPVPPTTGRSSQPTHSNTFRPHNKLEEVPHDFAVEWYTSLENLAAYNHDVSYAVDNLVQLSNTDHEINFPEETPDTVKKEMLKFISQNESSWYNFSGGRGSLKADLLAQIAINGALSAEIIPGSNAGAIPDHVKQVVRVAPKHIRFLYDREQDTYLPYQAPQYTLGSKLNSSKLIELNMNQYHFIAWRRMSEGPYPTPPFMAALDGLLIQKDMLGNFKQIMNKLGMLGFLSVEVAPPDPLPGESDSVYWERCLAYLNDTVYPQLEKNLGKGMVAGFKDSHEFKLQGNNMNVQGAEGLMKTVELIVMAGLKQDPNMMGRNFSTTETMGRVILSKMMSQVKEYQNMADSFFEELYLMALRLEGFSPEWVKVESKEPTVHDEFKREQASEKLIANVIAKRNAGIIDQLQAANELGYDKPALEEAPSPMPLPGTEDDDDKNEDDDDDDDAKDPENEEENEDDLVGIISRHEHRLRVDLPAFDYGDHAGCNHSVTATSFREFSDFNDPVLEKFTKSYFNATYKNFRSSMKTAAIRAGRRLSSMPDTASLSMVQNAVYAETVIGFVADFAVPQQDVSSMHLPKMYSHYRGDKSAFPEGFKKAPQGAVQFEDGDDIPDAILNLDDFRTIEYMKNSDPLYLGKFVTDEDTKKRLFDYLEKEYVNGGLPIGNNPDLIEKFQREFFRVMNLSAYKIRRIIDTTVNKVRNFARLQYMKQAQVVEYECVEIEDQLTCEHCRYMNGTVFSVSTGIDRISREVNAGPGQVPNAAPFFTNTPIADATKLTPDDLAAAGFSSAPYHPHCRGINLARF